MQMDGLQLKRSQMANGTCCQQKTKIPSCQPSLIRAVGDRDHRSTMKLIIMAGFIIRERRMLMVLSISCDIAYGSNLSRLQESAGFPEFPGLFDFFSFRQMHNWTPEERRALLMACRLLLQQTAYSSWTPDWVLVEHALRKIKHVRLS